MTQYPWPRRRFSGPADITPFLRLKSRRGMSRAERRVADAYTVDDLREIARRRTPAGPITRHVPIPGSLSRTTPTAAPASAVRKAAR